MIDGDAQNNRRLLDEEDMQTIVVSAMCIVGVFVSACVLGSAAGLAVWLFRALSGL